MENDKIPSRIFDNLDDFNVDIAPLPYIDAYYHRTTAYDLYISQLILFDTALTNSNVICYLKEFCDSVSLILNATAMSLSILEERYPVSLTCLIFIKGARTLMLTNSMFGCQPVHS